MLLSRVTYADRMDGAASSFGRPAVSSTNRQQRCNTRPYRRRSCLTLRAQRPVMPRHCTPTARCIVALCPLYLLRHPLKQAATTTCQPCPPFPIRYTRCRGLASLLTPFNIFRATPAPAFSQHTIFFCRCPLQSLRSPAQFINLLASKRTAPRPPSPAAYPERQEDPFPRRQQVPCLANPPMPSPPAHGLLFYTARRRH